MNSQTSLIEIDDVDFYFVWAGGNFVATAPFCHNHANLESKLSVCR